MAPRRFRLKSPTPSSLASIPYPGLRPLTTLPFALRSTSPNKPLPLSPAMIGGLAAIGTLALLSAVGVGLALHARYCRRSDCSVCSTIVCFTRLRGSHTIRTYDHGSPRPQTQQDAYPQAPRALVYLLEPTVQDSRILYQTSLSSITLPPELHTHGPQHPEMATSSSVVSTRGSITPSVVSSGCAPTSGVPGVLHSHPSPRKLPTPPERKVTYSGGTLYCGSNLSEDISTITLPSFVEHEHHGSIPSPMLAPPELPMAEGVRSPPSPRRSSLHSQPPRSRSRVTNITAPTTSPSKTHLGRDFPSPSLLVPDRQSHLPHRTRSSSRIRHELAVAELKSVVQVVQPGTPETSTQPRMNHSHPNTLLPLKIPTHTPFVLGDHDSSSMDGRPPFFTERGASHDHPRLVPLQQSPHETLWGHAESSTNDAAEPSPPYQPPVVGFSSSCSNPDERCPRAVSQTRSSLSTVPSVSAFPSPPDFTPGPRDNASSIISDYSTSGQLFPLAILWENNPVRGVETASLNEGKTPTPDADLAPRPVPTINSRSIVNRHLHLGSTGREDASARAGVPTRISSLRRLSRMPLGPRQMSGGLTPL